MMLSSIALALFPTRVVMSFDVLQIKNPSSAGGITVPHQQQPGTVGSHLVQWAIVAALVAASDVLASMRVDWV